MSHQSLSRIHVTVRLLPDLLTELRQVAEEEDRSLNSVFNRAVNTYLELRRRRRARLLASQEDKAS